jgi:rod shape-determining protein MreC
VPKPTHIDVRPFLYLALGLATWWLLPVVVRSFVRDSFIELQAPVVLAESRLGDLQRYWEKYLARSQRDMIAITRDIARVNNGLMLERRRLLALEQENKRLVDLLGMPGSPEYRTLVARVAQRDLNTWWQRLVLRRGRVDGVREGSPVVAGGDYVIGRVVKVARHTCEVQLVSDPGFRISANIEGDERAVVYQGRMNEPFVPPAGMLTHLPVDYAIPPEGYGTGVNVYTSGSGGIFPGGLLIGTIYGELVKTKDGLFYESDVALNPQLASLEEAAILILLKPEILP